MKLKTAGLLCTVLGVASATTGVDFSTPLTLKEFECFKSNGLGFVMPRAWKSGGSFDTNAIGNIKNAHAAGIPNVDVYMFPCRGKSASSQVASLVSELSGHPYGMIWLDIETNPSSGCSWESFSHASNCEYLGELVSEVKSHGKTPGIYSSQYMWSNIMGSATACEKFTSVGLWYAHYDGVASFSDWESHKFGGWTKPSIKQYKGTTTYCGAGVDFSWY